MQYPFTKFELIDLAQLDTMPKPQVIEPLCLYAFSADKGPEEFLDCRKEQFHQYFGDDSQICFSRHGQPLLQAAVTVDNGGRVLARRVVAPDATLANLSIIAKVKQEEAQKKNIAGELLYTDNVTGAETTEPVTNSTPNEPIMVKVASIKYECKTVKDAKNMQELIVEIQALLKDSEVDTESNSFVYPLFIIADNGRGKSNKRFRISPQYAKSKTTDYCKYTFECIENNKTLETIPFILDPSVIENNVCKSLDSTIQKYSYQLKCKLFEDVYELFVKKVASLSGNTEEYCRMHDLLFGREKRNTLAMNNVVVDLESGFNLSYMYGIDLESGTNGSFGDAPWGKDAYNKELVKVFNGSYSNHIYDLDNLKLDLIIDANYPYEVKREIENLVSFREDCAYLQDMGINITSIEDITSMLFDIKKNRYIALYMNSYDVIDPYSKKQIPVTITYSLAKLMINHFKNGRNRPVAGQLYNMIISDCITGTLNFMPLVTPSYDQKEILADNKVNYCCYYDNVLTLETLYTTQEEETQFSFLNNTLAIQEIMKVVRTKCPKIRYSFLDGEDLKKYQEDVQAILDRYSNNFLHLKLVYLNDPTMVVNKVYYAAIEVKFRNFIMAEHFKIMALV